MMMQHLSKPTSEQKKKESLRHHSFFLMNGGSGDSENSDSTYAKKGKEDHGKDKDPSALWRDFVGEKTHHIASLYEEKDMDDCLDEEKPPPGTKDHTEVILPCPSDEIQDGEMITHKVASNAEENPNQSGPTPRKSNRSSSFPVSLEEGWKGIMVASFGASGTLSTSTSVRSSLLLDHESEGSFATTDYGSFVMASSTETASEAPTFPSDAAWVPVLSDNDNDYNDDEDHDSNNDHDPSASKHKTGNDKNPVYAALVLDSMLGSESETEKHNDGKEEDSLLWTWVGGDGNMDDFQNADASPPPTEEIAFDVSWEDAVVGDDEETNSGNNSNGDIKSNEGSDEMPTSPDSHVNNSDDDDDTARDGPSLSLFAACTYSRVFGLDYLHDQHESRSDDDEEDNEGGNEEEDYTNEPPPMRSTIPYGGSTVPETRSDNDGHGRDHHAGGLQQSSTKCSKKCLWITVITGLLLVFGLAFMVIYFAIETIQGSGRL